MSQTTYSLNMDAGKKGFVVDNGPQDILTYNNPSNAIPYGQMIAKVSGDEDGVKLPSLTGDDMLGVALQNMNSTDEEWAVLSAIAAMRKGRIWVRCEEAITPDDSVFVRFEGRAQVQTFVLDADIITDNIVTVTVDGNVLTETYAADHVTTMGLFAAQIQAQASVSTAVVGGAGNRTITITSVIGTETSETVLEDEGITLGVSQAGIVVTETTSGVENEARGRFRTDADTTTAVAVTTARFVSDSITTSDSEILAIVELSLV